MPEYAQLETVKLSDLAGSEAYITAVRTANTKYGERFVVEMASSPDAEAEAQTWIGTGGRRGDTLAGIKALGKTQKVAFTAVQTGQPKPFVSIEVL